MVWMNQVLQVSTTICVNDRLRKLIVAPLYVANQETSICHTKCKVRKSLRIVTFPAQEGGTKLICQMAKPFTKTMLHKAVFTSHTKPRDCNFQKRNSVQHTPMSSSCAQVTVPLLSQNVCGCLNCYFLFVERKQVGDRVLKNKLPPQRFDQGSARMRGQKLASSNHSSAVISLGVSPLNMHRRLSHSQLERLGTKRVRCFAKNSSGLISAPIRFRIARIDVQQLAPVPLRTECTTPVNCQFEKTGEPLEPSNTSAEHSKRSPATSFTLWLLICFDPPMGSCTMCTTSFTPTSTVCLRSMAASMTSVCPLVLVSSAIRAKSKERSHTKKSSGSKRAMTTLVFW